MNPELFSKKLFIARNVEGKPNFKELAVLRKLEEKLSADPAFVCLAPFGSKFFGSSIDRSDLDVHVLCDWPKQEHKTKEIVDIIEKVVKEERIKIHYLLRNINLNQLQELLDQHQHFFGVTLGMMTQVVIGSKVEHYRKILRDWIHKLSDEERTQIKSEILAYLLRMESSGYPKRQVRLHISDNASGNIVKERMKLWENRVGKIWGL